jgi:hypothetical protein
VALFLGDEEPDRVDEFRIADRGGVVAGGFHQVGAVRGFAQLPGAEGSGDG